MRRCQMSLKGRRALAVPLRLPGPVCRPFLMSHEHDIITTDIHAGT